MIGPDASTLTRWVADARARTLSILDELDDSQLALPPYLPTVNPFRWELGHVVWFQEHFALEQGVGLDPVDPEAVIRFDSAAVGHERRWRQEPWSRDRIRAYANAVCERVLEVVASRAIDRGLRDRILLGVFHEDMHGEAFAYMRQALALPPPKTAAEPAVDAPPAPGGDVEMSIGTFRLGARDDGRFVFDNEQWAHAVEVAPFRIARTPVSQAELAAFVDDGGYERPEHWSAAGWSWRQAVSADRPLYWKPDGGGGWMRRRFDRWLSVEPELPALHVNAYEAEAFCRWSGRRLPTEVEWEAAVAGSDGVRAHPWGEDGPDPEHANLDARVLGCVPRGAHAAGDTPEGCRQLYGNVWEWTSSAFEPYPGFVPGVYREYSEPWFGSRRVLRGGCWATRSRMLRSTLRNFFTPDRRDVFAGFRTCAS